MFSRLFSCRRGVVSVEAAFVFPVLIMLVVGGMEFALLLFTYSSMQTAAREVSRRLAVNSSTPAQAKAEVIGRLPRWAAADAQVEVLQSTPGVASSNIITVSVMIPAADAVPIGFFTRMTKDWDLETQVVMKQEQPL